MAKWVALLRGINVSGHRPIRMAELRSWMEELGLDKVATYIQSGNIVFSAQDRSAGRLAQRIRAQILTHSGFDVPVVLRSAARMSSIAKANPFPAEAAREGKNVSVLFLSGKPKADGLVALSEVDSGDDQFEAIGKEIYVLCPNGAARTKLLSGSALRKLGVDATGRNWKTVMKLNEMLAEL